MTRPLHIQLIGIVVLSEHMGRSVASCMWGTHLGWVSMQTWSSCWRRDNKKTLVEVLKGNGCATQDRTRPKVAQQPTFLCSIPVSIVFFFLLVSHTVCFTDNWSTQAVPSYGIQGLALFSYLISLFSRHTGELENFNSMMTKYAPKRMAFEYVLYLSEMLYNHIIDNQLCRVKTTFYF